MPDPRLPSWVEALIKDEVDQIRPVVQAALDQAYRSGHVAGWQAHEDQTADLLVETPITDLKASLRRVMRENNRLVAQRDRYQAVVKAARGIVRRYRSAGWGRDDTAETPKNAMLALVSVLIATVDALDKEEEDGR